MLGRCRGLPETPIGNSILAHVTNKYIVLVLSIWKQESTCKMIPSLGSLIPCPAAIFTPVHSLSIFWGVAPAPEPWQGQYLQFGRVVTLYPHRFLLFSEMKQHSPCMLWNHTVLKGDFSVGSLAKGMFSIRAGVEGVQFSREGEGESTGREANVVLIISVQLPHGKRHINNILYKLWQQHMLVCNAVQFSSKVRNPNLRWWDSTININKGNTIIHTIDFLFFPHEPCNSSWSQYHWCISDKDISHFFSSI